MGYGVVDELPEKEENRAEKKKPESGGPIEVRLSGIHRWLDRVDEARSCHLAERFGEEESPDDGMPDGRNHHERPSDTRHISAHGNLRRLADRRFSSWAAAWGPPEAPKFDARHYHGSIPPSGALSAASACCAAALARV
jgi:hypothetical protein